MKKVLVGIVLVASVFTSVGVMAAEETENTVKPTVNYNYGDDGTNPGNSITNPTEAASYKTVLIKKDGENGDIVYIDQAESGFVAATNFLLKSGTESNYGYYTATFGGAENGTTASYSFVIGDVPIQAGDMMTVADAAVEQENSGGVWFKKGFTFNTTVTEYNKFNSIKLVDKSTSQCIGAINLPECTVNGASDVVFGITVFNIPKEYKDNLVLYYSTDEVKTKEGAE